MLLKRDKPPMQGILKMSLKKAHGRLTCRAVKEEEKKRPTSNGKR